MVTADEIGRIAVFETLEPADRERLARVAADISLAPGEYAVHEGDERALFGVLEGADRGGQGRRRDRAGRRHAWCRRGLRRGAADTRDGVPGRVPRGRSHARVAHRAARLLRRRGGRARRSRRRSASSRAIGSADRAACRASRPSRRRRARSCSAIAGTPRARSSGTSSTATRSASDGSSRTCRPTPSSGGARCRPRATTRRSRRRTARRSCGRSFAGWPSCSASPTEPEAAEYDTVVVGAGPAGLAAAVYGASEGLRTIVVEREAPGGQAGTSSRIENYLGFPSGVSGEELASRALQQARRLGAEILVTRSITRIDAATRQVHLDGGDVLRARTIILACGVAWRQLAIEGFDRLAGKGIFYGAARSEAPNTHGLDIHIIGAGNSAGQAAMFFSTHARSVTILYRGESLEKSMSRYLIDQLATRPNIRVLLPEPRSSPRTATSRSRRSTSATARPARRPGSSRAGSSSSSARTPRRRGCRRRSRSTSAATCSPGSDVRAAGRWELDRDPYLLETSVPGIFACGDVRFSPVKRVAAAVGEGSMAIAFVHQYLRESEPELDHGSRNASSPSRR